MNHAQAADLADKVIKKASGMGCYEICPVCGSDEWHVFWFRPGPGYISLLQADCARCTRAAA